MTKAEAIPGTKAVIDYSEELVTVTANDGLDANVIVELDNGEEFDIHPKHLIRVTGVTDDIDYNSHFLCW